MWNVNVYQPFAPPVFTGISPDTGSSNSDRLTDTGVLPIQGTASSQGSISLFETGVGLIDTVTVDNTGHWVSNHFNNTTTPLAEGETFFTAVQTSNGQTSIPTADWFVTVDLTPPAVTLSVPPTTASINPQLTVTA